MVHRGHSRECTPLSQRGSDGMAVIAAQEQVAEHGDDEQGAA